MMSTMRARRSCVRLRCVQTQYVTQAAPHSLGCVEGNAIGEIDYSFPVDTLPDLRGGEARENYDSKGERSVPDSRLLWRRQRGFRLRLSPGLRLRLLLVLRLHRVGVDGHVGEMLVSFSYVLRVL